MAANLVLAVPSKGRLQENATAFFARAGLHLVRGQGARDYRGKLAGVDGVEVAFVSASEIVALLASGQAHFGITGEDLVRETVDEVDSKLVLLTPLGFGQANVVVAVPQAWIDVRTMADLEDVAAGFYTRRRERMRVATKYVNLTRRFFASHHVADYRVVESLGATEGAPAAGQAELIVDITTTGATLAANSLKVLDDGVILRSEANLVASLRAEWSPVAREAARMILGRIAAEESARLNREVRAFFGTGVVPDLSAAACAKFDAFPRGVGMDCLTFTCGIDKVAPLADFLIAGGAKHVAVASIEYAFSPENRLQQALLGRLDTSTGR